MNQKQMKRLYIERFYLNRADEMNIDDDGEHQLSDGAHQSSYRLSGTP